MSRNAIAVSDSKTMSAGIALDEILQNKQSATALKLVIHTYSQIPNT
jgi:hypothetical protein